MYHELAAFVRIRQESLTSEDHRYTVRATTILVTSIPENFLDIKTLKQIFSVFPGGVRNVFLNRDCSELLEDVEERDKIAYQLEAAETELIVKANKAYRKAQANKEKGDDKEKLQEVAPAENSEIAQEPKASSPPEETTETEYLAEKYLPKTKRPTHRLPIIKWMPSLPLIGKKVLLYIGILTL